MFGKNLTQYNDKLEKIEAEKLFEKIMNPKEEIKSLLKQLETISSIDPKKYRKLKTSLPYFTSGIFNPPFRKKENFAWIQYFILDIDHLRQKDLTPKTLKQKLANDPHLYYAFTSPSGDGLKIVFRLEEKCYDAQKFSMFYKLFSASFAKKYNIEQVIDHSTSDVTRACFFSYDPDATDNLFPKDVVLNDYINFNDYENVEQAKLDLKEIEKNSTTEQETEKEQISQSVFDEIKASLNPKIKTKKEKIIFVPEQLNQIIDPIKSKMQEYKINLKDAQDIHYGKKIVFEVEQNWAEINVFYGKKGYTIVKTPKKGSNPELTEITHNILCEMFY